MADPKATPRMLPSAIGSRGDKLFPPKKKDRSTGSSSNIFPDIGGAGQQCQRTSPLTSTSTSSSRASLHHTISLQAQPSSPTKFPKIAKASSISNLAALQLGSVHRTTSLPVEGLRADLCRSPSCPALWSCDLAEDDSPLDFRQDPLWNEEARGREDYSRRSQDFSNSVSPTKLPSIFGGSTTVMSNKSNNSNKSIGSKTGMRRSSSLQSRLSSSLVDAPQITGTHHTARTSKRDKASTTRASFPFPSKGGGGDGGHQDVSPARRVNPMLLPMRDGRGRRTNSKKGGTTPGTLHTSEGTSGDSGVSVGFRPSDRSDSSAAHDGSEQGAIWGPEAEVEVEIDDETMEGRLQQAQMPSSKGAATPRASTNHSDRKSEDSRTSLSAEKCREWLENVSEDGTPRTSRDKEAFKMPKIN